MTEDLATGFPNNVMRGMKLLDKYRPKWEDVINVNALAHDDILSQLEISMLKPDKYADFNNFISEYISKNTGFENFVSGDLGDLDNNIYFIFGFNTCEYFHSIIDILPNGLTTDEWEEAYDQVETNLEISLAETWRELILKRRGNDDRDK